MYLNINDVSADAIKKAQEVLKAGPMGTGDNVRKDITSASGAAAYNLQPVAMLLQPVITPWRNMIPRVQNQRGGTSSEWRIISALLNNNFDPTVTSEGNPGNRLSYTYTPASAVFAEFALGDRVTWAAEDAAKGFEGDLRARGVTNTLFALMMMEELQIGFGRISNLAAVTAPTVSSATTGGSIADGTYSVYVRAIIGVGDGTNTRGRKSSGTSTGAISGSNVNVIKAYTPWVEGAVGYEWWVSNDAGSTVYLQTTTGVNCVKLTTFQSSTTSGIPADNVANTLGMNGLIAGMTAAAGAQITTLATDSTNFLGTDFVLDDIDAANKSAWDNAKADPEVIFMNSTQLIRATNLVLAANGAPTMFVQAASNEMAQLTGGYMLANYINKVTGRTQKVRVHPNLPDGTMLALSMNIPFPTGGDMVGIDIETSRDYQQVEYAAVARRYDYEVFCREVLRHKFIGGSWVIRNAKSNRTA